MASIGKKSIRIGKPSDVEVRILTRSGGSVSAVSANAKHGFSKIVRDSISLIANHGVDGDAHAGAFVKHRYLARWHPLMPNERQVHLIDESLFEAVRREGFDVGPGDLGENITTQGPDLLRLPLGTTLNLGSHAVIELRGLRTPCVLIDRFQNGLLKALIRPKDTPSYRAGVMAIVQKSGLVRAGDTLTATLPPSPWQELPAI
jgi:MOSC domain-containing protein YiiM